MTGINRQPAGLLNLLQVQAGGQNPDNLAETVRPTIDVGPYYEAERLTALQEPFSLTVGQADFIEVPAREKWLALAMAAEMDNLTTSGNDVFINFGIERVPNLGLNAIWLFGESSTMNAATNVNNQIVLGRFLPRPLMLAPGWRFVMQLGANSGVSPATGTMQLLVVRLDI